ncbi:hypothetical protein LCGC14_0578880 [marine sediment metagenome]|uniref:Uncharacterized protein n=1 Tax=marine sediment metagenome TaxID=412755 RepID=A0A0F9U3D5_9ZZZZ|nr:hypothetical protein [bacterium]
MSDKINLGMEVYDFHSGLITENFPLNSLKGNLMISGEGRSERTALLSHILNQFYARHPDIGVLLIQLGSNEDTYLYHLDKVFEYGDPELNIPYFTGKWFTDRMSERFKNYLNAIFGFRYETKWVIANLTLPYVNLSLPSSIIDFLESLKRYLISLPYYEVFIDIKVESFERAIEIFQEDPVLESTVMLPLKGGLEWLDLWSKGKKICVDLTKCGIYQQKLLVTLITQSILNYIDHNNSDSPIGIVVIEDADNIMEKPPYEEYRKKHESNMEYIRNIKEESSVLTREKIEEVYEDENYLMNVQLEEIYRRLIGSEFRDRNISLITVFENLSNIYNCVRNFTQIQLQVDEVK